MGNQVRGMHYARGLIYAPFSSSGASSGRGCCCSSQEIATLPPHERVLLSVTEGSTPIYAARPRGEAPEELEEVFYEDVRLLHTLSLSVTMGMKTVSCCLFCPLLNRSGAGSLGLSVDPGVYAE